MHEQPKAHSPKDLNFNLIRRHSSDHVEVEFIGTLQGRSVTWQATIQTIKNYYLGNLNLHIPLRLHQLIEIHDNYTHPQLFVILNLPCIDDAAIMRTIIMIRKYKRLSPGRHEYGEPIVFDIE